MTLGFIEQAKGPGLGFLFPGQGSQSVGMGQELYEKSVSAREIFQEVDEALGRSLSQILFEGPEETLRDTINAQPAIMTVSLACLRGLEEVLGSKAMPRPILMAGHSLGEYTALAAAGVLDISDTARLVQKRGELMQEACEKNPGVMAAILGLDEMTLEEIARSTGTYVSNINTSEQIVISGERMALANALDMAVARGAKKAIPLNVGGAFHSGLMSEAQSGLIDAISGITFHDANIPIIANCTGRPLTNADDIKSELISQICSCVQWKRSVDYMLGIGLTEFMEIGPGRAISGMVKRISRKAKIHNVGDFASIINYSKN